MNRSDTLENLKYMVLYKFKDKDVKIFLFGSWAKGKEKHTSDIDIGICGPDLFSQELAFLRQEIEDSTI